MKHNLSSAAKAIATKSKHSKYLNQLVRVDQAGELAADYIYKGQLMVFKHTELKPLITHMWEQEVHHHKTFDTLQTEGRVRPSLLTPVWRIAALSLGFLTAIRGKESAMACTEAVETVIGGHYNSQLRYLLEAEMKTKEGNEGIENLKKIVSEFRDDELEHLETAVANDAHGAKPYWLLTEVIKKGCAAAIKIAERV
ncbi:putative monooxygenase [Starmerella bacillaris]|uniref:5-demethoxyubiquinone hydroxylase, mitochondrial n=1 Tax=Starmerella bacillaris TaxID=1247836 RepID=A0AAV5RD89_STABA|nr:putative monooxygenase [Starmerella bacillaris]